MVKVKLTFAGRDSSLGLEEVKVRRIPRQSAHEGGKVVSSRTGRLYPQRRCYLVSGTEPAVPYGCKGYNEVKRHLMLQLQVPTPDRKKGDCMTARC